MGHNTLVRIRFNKEPKFRNLHSLATFRARDFNAYHRAIHDSAEAVSCITGTVLRSDAW